MTVREPGEQVGRSFFDAQFYITCIKTFKFLVMFGDARHGVHCLRWREDIKMLQVRPLAPFGL